MSVSAVGGESRTHPQTQNQTPGQPPRNLWLARKEGWGSANPTKKFREVSAPRLRRGPTERRPAPVACAGRDSALGARCHAPSSPFPRSPAGRPVWVTWRRGRSPYADPAGKEGRAPAGKGRRGGGGPGRGCAEGRPERLGFPAEPRGPELPLSSPPVAGPPRPPRPPVLPTSR